MAIHPSTTSPNIVEDGLDVGPTTSTSFAIEKFLHERQERPYGTCTKAWSHTEYSNMNDSGIVYTQKVTRCILFQFKKYFS